MKKLKYFFLIINLFFIPKKVESEKNELFFDSSERQKIAMRNVKNIITSINETDYNKAIYYFSELESIDLTKINYPLSLLYDLINGVGNGREDFFVLGFKHIFFKKARKLLKKYF